MRAKSRIFAGSVCEQEVYTLPDRTKDVKKAEPRPRFSSAEEYEDFKQRLARRNHARMFNATISPASLNTTITLDNEHEVHTFAEADGSINPFWRRLRRLNPDAQIALYPGRGKTTSRIHFHMISNGLTEEQIREKWDGGTLIRIEHLREHNYYNGVDHGRDYTGLANYLFDHWTPEQGGHRWKATRNLSQPEKEAPTLALRTYTEKKAPIAPKGYKLVEARATKCGYIYYKYVREPEKPKRRKKRE